MTREQLQERLTAYGPRATQSTLIALCALVAFGVAVLLAFLKASPQSRILWLSFLILNSSIVLLGTALALRTARYRAERLHLLCPRYVGDRLSAEPARLRSRRGAAARAGLKSFPIEPVRFSRTRLTKSRFPRRSLHWSGQIALP
jgi:hypothetical protein